MSGSAKLIQDISEKVDYGSLGFGAKLPSTHEMAKTYGIAYPTAHKAIRQLVDKGYLRRHQGEGTYVAKNVKPKTRKVALAIRTKGHLFGKVAQEILDMLQEHDYITEVVPLGEHTVTLSAINHLRRVIDGNPYVIISEYNDDPKYIDLIKEALSAKLSVLWFLCDNSPGKLDGHVFSHDTYKGFYKIGSHLAGLGHKRIGVFAIEEFFSQDHPCARAMATLKKEHCDLEFVPIRGNQGFDVPYDEQMHCVKEVLCDINRPTAVMCSVDVRAKFVVDWARELGLRVPEDLSVTGFFDTPWAHSYNLTTVNVCVDKIVAGVVYMLNSLEDEVYKQMKHHIIIEPELVIRSSTGPVGTAE